jgi:hypothetical protein
MTAATLTPLQSSRDHQFSDQEHVLRFEPMRWWQTGSLGRLVISAIRELLA